MKKRILTLGILSILLITSCKKETAKSEPKAETEEITTAVPDEQPSVAEQAAETQDSVVTETSTETPIKVADAKKEVVKAVEDVKNQAVNKAVQQSETVTKKVENTTTKETEKATKVVESVTEKTSTVKETAQKEIDNVTKEAEAVKKEISTPAAKAPKQLTQAEKITRGKTLFTTGICKNCHNQTKKLIGPTLVIIGSTYKKKKGRIANFLQGNAKPIVDPKRFKMMKPNIDDVTRHMPIQDLEALEAYIMSFAK